MAINNPMGAVSSYFTIFTVILYLELMGASATCSSLHMISDCKKGSAAALFIFGDSYFDVGNNNYINTSTLDQANFWPYGKSYFNSPTGRFSDGRLISDFIAEYAKVPIPVPIMQPRNEEDNYINGANFASAGAGSLVQTFQGASPKSGQWCYFYQINFRPQTWPKNENPAILDFDRTKNIMAPIPPRMLQVIDLKTQLNNYKKVKFWLRNKLGYSRSDKILKSAVYLISIGTNDYLSPFLTNSTLIASYSSPQYVQMVIGKLTTMVQEIYKNGGRKFGFLNLGDLGCLPGLRMLNPPTKNGCLEEASKLAKLHNLELQSLLLEMQKKLKGFTYSLYDFNRSLRQRMNHPSIYGFKEGIRACCGTGRYRGIYSCGGKRPVKQFEVCKSPKRHVFWDSYHLTQTIYQQMAAEMWNGPMRLTGPSTLKTSLSMSLISINVQKEESTNSSTSVSKA